MPRKHRIPGYTHHKATNQAYVRLNGKCHYLGAYGTPESRQRYAALLAQWEAGNRQPIDSRPQQTPSNGTVAELCLAYWQHAERRYKSGHVYSVRAALRLLRQQYAYLPVADFTAQELDAIRRLLIAEGKTRKYVNQLADCIRRCFRWGCSQNRVPPEVLVRLDSLGGLRRGCSDAQERPPVPPVADEVVEATLPHLGPVVADMVRLQRLTGCRPTEAASIRPADVDTSGEVWLYRPQRHKTQHHGKQRVVALGPRAQEVLRPYLLRAATEFCFSTGPGRRYTKDSYAQAVRRAVLRANRSRAEQGLPALPHWAPNQLRHAAATEVRRLFGLEAAQHTLGHSRTDTTEIYAERNLQQVIQVAKQVG